MKPLKKNILGMSNISSISSGPRQTNFELLRMLSMFLVLITHANLVSLDLPFPSDFEKAPLNALTRTFFESISIVCVNVFILISGWFGIKPTVKGLTNFVFQCAFFLIGIYAISLLIGRTSLSIVGIMDCLCLTTGNWFIQAYIGLYILAPILNLFLEKSNKFHIGVFLIAFYFFQSYFGIFRSALFIQDGYSTFSFIGLYVLAGYVKLYGQRFFKWGLLIYISCVVINTVLYPFTIKYFPVIHIYNYINPFVVIGATGLLMTFNGLSIKTNKTINSISKSCFAVYLFHTNPNIYDSIFISAIKRIYFNFDGITCLSIIFVFLVAIFIISLICDVPRRIIWSIISHKNIWGKFQSAFHTI